ncbi:glycosyltransferase family 2 protein [Nocardia sp. NPDC101769]|uniref:glycosyltransferase family 2 protein n=1 Tax=Nocardia sp. NPDC101769 TaxID=3364333 RepID=UPI0037F3945B
MADIVMVGIFTEIRAPSTQTSAERMKFVECHQNMARLSVVIPVLHEERGITETLDRLTAQASIDQVILVDNGAIGETRRVIAHYAIACPKIDVVSEPVRGIAHARNTGFDRARGDLIARIEARTLVASNWGETIRQFFADHPAIDAINGATTYHDSPIRSVRHRRIGFDRGTYAGGTRIEKLPRANMALRRSAWMGVRADTCSSPDLLEDLDLALCLVRRGFRIQQADQMRAQISARHHKISPRDHWRYERDRLRTLEAHGFEIAVRHRIHGAGAWLTHSLQWPIYRFWDLERRRFTLCSTERGLLDPNPSQSRAPLAPSYSPLPTRPHRHPKADAPLSARVAANSQQ